MAQLWSEYLSREIRGSLQKIFSTILLCFGCLIMDLQAGHTLQQFEEGATLGRTNFRGENHAKHFSGFGGFWLRILGLILQNFSSRSKG